MTSAGEKREGKKSETMMRMYNVGDYYEIIEKVGRGTYGTVYKAKGVKDNKFYAIKKLENNDVKLQQQGFPITALREITLLKQIDHPNIIKLKEIIVSRPNKRNLFRGSTFLVFEYMDHDFAGLFKMKIKYSLPEIKTIVRQLLEGVNYLHKNKILHRDIKSANILLNDDGDVKLADFGLGRKVRFENLLTYKVVTLWYRAPELLLGCKAYTDKIDVWSLGCVIAEFFTGEVIFRKQTEFAQMQRIYEVVGDFEANGIVINEESTKIYQNLQDLRPRKHYKKDIGNYLRKFSQSISQTTIDFIQRMLHLDPSKRMSCEQALRHPFFSQQPLPCPRGQIQKMEYEYHEMFKDRSIKIQRDLRKDKEYDEPKSYQPRRDHFKQEKVYPPPSNNYRRDQRKPYYHNPERIEDLDRRNYKDEYSYNEKKHQKYKGSRSSGSVHSNSGSSSSPSSLSSNTERSGRSRNRPDLKRREERYSRDPKYERESSYRDKEERKRYYPRQDKRYPQKYQRRREEREDKYYQRETEEKRYKSYRQDQTKRGSRERRREYRDEKYAPRIEEKKYQAKQSRRESLDKRDDFKSEKKEGRKRPETIEERRFQKGEEKRSEKREEPRVGKNEDRRQEKREERRPQTNQERRVDVKEERKAEGRDQRRSQKRDYIGKDEYKGSKDRGYQGRYEKGGYESKYYEQRDYKKKDEKYSRNERDKYGAYQKHGEVVRRDELDSKRLMYGGRNQYKKKDYGYSESSDDRSSHHHKREKDYKHHKSSHYDTHSRKNYYKKQYQGSHDHRNH